MKQVQHPRGNTATNMAWTFPESLLSYDTTLKQYRLHDGVTPGGWLLVREADALIEFQSIIAKTVPATVWLPTDIGSLLQVSVAGVYTLPAVPASLAVGRGFRVRASIGGVSMQRTGVDQIDDANTLSNTINIANNQMIQFAKKAAGIWMVLGKY